MLPFYGATLASIFVLSSPVVLSQMLNQIEVYAMAQTLISPPLYIQQQRSLDSQRLVVRGPTGRNARWVWRLPKDQQVMIYPTDQPMTPHFAFVDRPSLSILSSDEMFGFDPTTSRCPRLRRIQQYSTMVLISDKPSLVGAIVAPADPLLRISSVRATMSLNLPTTTDNLFLEEIASASDADHFVWKYEGETAGYLVTDVSVLTKPAPVVVDVLLIHLAGEEPCKQLLLYAMLPHRLAGQVDLVCSEGVVGVAKVTARNEQ